MTRGRKSCGLPDITNGKFASTTDLLFGAKITYTCNDGYRLVGESTAECILGDSGVHWSHVPHCAIIPCSPPPEIKNGKINSGAGDFTVGAVVTYSCNEHFSLIGNAEIHCTTTDDKLDGKWSGPAPECKVVRCENPKVKNGRKLSGFGTEHTYKNTVIFECDSGHVLNGSGVVTCEADNTWKPRLPTCDPIPCGPAPQFHFAELTSAVGDSSPAETKLMYRCKPGYALASGKSSVVTCLRGPTWSVDSDFCIRQQCAPPKIENGDVIAENFMFGTVVTFRCHPGGFDVTKSRFIAGATSGGLHAVVWGKNPFWAIFWKAPNFFSFFSWEKYSDTLADVPPVGRHSDSRCEEPPTIDNGMHNGTKGTVFVHGSTVAYKCRDGFTLAGAALLQCMAGDQYRGVWNEPAPECRGGANVIIAGIFPLLLAMLVTNV
ncbi:PREDICTED: complement receptor type 1-like [Charadrius vociferus]|uniref:complement receptor type 1-like n=1 Tax=Charadrius vociferus TaxID=50402 RepID=UPI0005217932|nr:PREDICTED: complement receptor type 1-like [Charadrius vociferus]